MQLRPSPRLALIAATLAVAAAASLAAAGSAAARNPQIAGLQVALRAYGLYGGRVDAVAGPLTVAATKAFQRRARIPVTGRADARTRRSLGAVGGPLFGQRTLFLHRFGWDVAVLQFVLAEHGLSRGPLDGWFDRATLLGVRRFQRRAGIEPDGVVGPATFAALSRAAAVPLAAHRSRPGATQPSPVTAPPAASRAAPPPARTVRYRVQPGDTLTHIALRAATTVRRLAGLNGLRVDEVLPEGRVLRLPPPAAPQEAPPTPVRDLLDEWSLRLGVDRGLVRALAWVESGYQPHVVSPVGALGVMQVMPDTWDWVEQSVLRRDVPMTTAGNIEVGVTYLRHLLGLFGGDRRLAVAGWLQGPHSVQREGVHAETLPFVNAVLDLSRRV